VGYQRIHAMLFCEGWQRNRKREYRPMGLENGVELKFSRSKNSTDNAIIEPFTVVSGKNAIHPLAFIPEKCEK